MAEERFTCYDRPQDKYGLLLRHRMQNLDAVMEQLELLFVDYSCYSILDCACGDGLYAAELATLGRAVSAADESADAGKQLKKRLFGQRATVPFQQADIDSLEQVYPEEFGAVLCMNSELARYGDAKAAMQALFRPLNRHGVLVIGMMDLEQLATQPETIVPLLLGEEYGGRKCGVIRQIRHDEARESVDVRYIYHLEDLETGAITVDWEAARYNSLTVETMYRLAEESGWHIHKDVVVGGERLFVCGTEPPVPYVGPPSIHWKKDATDNGEV